MRNNPQTAPGRKTQPEQEKKTNSRPQDYNPTDRDHATWRICKRDVHMSATWQTDGVPRRCTGGGGEGYAVKVNHDCYYCGIFFTFTPPPAPS
jgi:hypothetical protein